MNKELEYLFEKEFKQRDIKLSPAQGGCIANSFVAKFRNGDKIFVKKYSNQAVAKAESYGLKELSKQKYLKVPEVLLFTEGYLFLEFIENDSYNSKTFSKKFGESLALMHSTIEEKPGFYENNFIGSTIQLNDSDFSNWGEFFYEKRLKFQIELAIKRGYLTSGVSETLVRNRLKIVDVLNEVNLPNSLLHGDLWSGNYLTTNSGYVLIDPAVYYGSREAEFGIISIFGGFDANFYNGYFSIYPPLKNFNKRLEFYKLYHYLNHLNIFGRGYLNNVNTILKNIL